MDNDWQLRVNNINPAGEGPGVDGFKMITGVFNAFMPDLKFERKRSLLCGNDKVLVVSKVTGTVTNPSGVDEIPLFPGIPAPAIVGKRFETFAIDLHKFTNGQMRQAWHIEDWSNTGVSSMLRDGPPADVFDEAPLKPTKAPRLGPGINLPSQGPARRPNTIEQVFHAICISCSCNQCPSF